MIRIPQIGGFFNHIQRQTIGLSALSVWQLPNCRQMALEKAEVIQPMEFDEYINAILLCFCHVLLPPDTQQLSDFGEYIDLLPMSTDDSFKKNRRFSRLAPTILLESTDDSFSSHRGCLEKSIYFISKRSHFLLSPDSFSLHQLNQQTA